MRTLRTYPLVWSVVSLLAIVAAAAIVWWLVPDRTLSAQESMEDACADPSTITAFDVTIQAEGVTEWTESEVSKSPDGVISFTTRIYGEDQGPGSGAGVRSGVRLQSESFNTYEAPPPASARSSSTTPILVNVGGRYYNRRLENGQWTPWEVSTTSIDIVEGGLHNTFCGESLNMFDTFEYNGFEQINGVQTKKYTGIMDLQGNELDYRFEYWVGPDGRMVRTDRTNLANDRPITWTFSNWNEPNDIAPPVQETPAPKPTATPEPTHTPVLTNTPTPEPTNTPTHQHANTGAHQHARTSGSGRLAGAGPIGHYIRWSMAGVHDTRNRRGEDRLCDKRDQLPERTEQHGSRGALGPELVAPGQ